MNDVYNVSFFYLPAMNGPRSTQGSVLLNAVVAIASKEGFLVRSEVDQEA